MTPSRATEIIATAKSLAKHGPWSDQLRNVMTVAETSDVFRVWQTMAGSTCFMDSLLQIESKTNDDI